jgi:hypothetical protein
MADAARRTTGGASTAGLLEMEKFFGERDCKSLVSRLYHWTMTQRRDISILATAAKPLAARARYCMRPSESERQFGNLNGVCDGGSTG